MSLKRYLRNMKKNIHNKNFTFFPILIKKKDDLEILVKIYSLKKVNQLIINGTSVDIKKNDFLGFKYLIRDTSCVINGENIITIKNVFVLNIRQTDRLKKKTDMKKISSIETLDKILESMIIECESDFDGFFQTAYDFTCNSYRLQSWIWTSAIPYYYLSTNNAEIKQAKMDKILSNFESRVLKSQYRGAFEIRWDISESDNTINKIIAPNDLSMIARYVFIEAYKKTEKYIYLEYAQKIADWIMSESLTEDGLVFSGYSTSKNKWDKSWLYVDVGFILSLFSELYLLTSSNKYLNFGNNFVEAYTNNFYDKKNKYFIKTVHYDKPKNNTAFFTRGQGWALEGLISWYQINESKNLKQIIISVVETLMRYQNDNGSWYLLADKKKSGECGKTTPVIAYQLTRYLSFIEKNNIFVWKSVQKSLEWTENKMKFDNVGNGGIDSFTTEGNIVGNRFSSSSFTYSLAYYLMAKKYLDKYKIN